MIAYPCNLEKLLSTWKRAIGSFFLVNFKVFLILPNHSNDLEQGGERLINIGRFTQLATCIFRLVDPFAPRKVAEGHPEQVELDKVGGLDDNVLYYL